MTRFTIHSLRTQIVLGMVASIVLMFVLSTLSLHFVLRHHIYNQFFTELHDRARTLGKYVEYDDGKVFFEWAHYDEQSNMQLNTDDGAGCIFKVWDAAGKEVAQVNIFKNFSLQSVDTLNLELDGPPRFKPIVLPDGSNAYEVSLRSRAIYERDTDEDEDEEDKIIPSLADLPILNITAVRRTVSVEQTMFRMDATLLGATTATMVFSILGMLMLIAWGLRPLEPVMEQLKAIGSGDLSRRVNPGRLPRELVAIIQTVNDLLAALEIKVARERRFVANAAHELRNPITAVQANLEVGLLNKDDPELQEEVGQSCLEAAKHLQFVCERLLSLAGLQQDNIALELQQVDVVELVDSITDDLQETAAAKGISFVWEHSDQASVQTDPVLLNVILSNLLRNAVSYAMAGQAVKLENETRDDEVRVTVTNLMADPRQLDLEKVMEPFWRGEESRSLGQGNLGLGLTIVQTALDQLHGKIQCTLEAADQTAADETGDLSKQYFVATVTLPRLWAGSENKKTS